MVSPTQLCWSYHSSPPRQRYMPRGLSHKAQSWRPSCWGTRNPVITELSAMPAGRYDFCPFVQGWWWVSCSYHRLLCKADITSPCATLIRCCTLRYAPIDLIWLVVVLNFPDVLGQLSFPSATLCAEWVGVAIEARFERALCQTVVVFVRLMGHWVTHIYICVTRSQWVIFSTNILRIKEKFKWLLFGECYIIVSDTFSNLIRSIVLVNLGETNHSKAKW